TVPGVDLNEDGQLRTIRELAAFYPDLPFADRGGPLRFHYDNPNYSYGEAMILYGMMRKLRPKRVVEIGSGHTSCVILHTNCLFLNGGTVHKAIHPSPQLVHDLVGPNPPPGFEIIPKKVQDVGLPVFAELEADDILFVDSTHVSKVGSDVHYIVFEILPLLAA